MAHSRPDGGEFDILGIEGACTGEDAVVDQDAGADRQRDIARVMPVIVTQNHQPSVGESCVKGQKRSDAGGCMNRQRSGMGKVRDGRGSLADKDNPA